MEPFKDEGISLIAASVDPLEKAESTIEKLGLEFRIGYGLDAEKISREFGAYYDDEKKFLHATNFLLFPNKNVFVASYSNGPIGRFRARDVLNLVKFVKSGQKKSFSMENGRLVVE